ncbi:MAG: STAS domain-containing protein [bacterium]
MKDIRIESRPTKEGVELCLIGELLFADSREFMEKIPERVRDKGKVVIFNLEKLKFIDSSGLGAVLYASQACVMQKQEVHVTNACPNVLNSVRTIKKVGTFRLHEPSQP